MKKYLEKFYNWYFGLKKTLQVAILTSLWCVFLLFICLELFAPAFVFLFIASAFTLLIAVRHDKIKKEEQSKKTVDVNLKKYSVGIDSFSTSIYDITLPLRTKVVGVTFENRQEYLRIAKAGDRISICHAPTDEYKEATEIIHCNTGNKLGYIKKELAERLVVEFGDYFQLEGHISEITGGDNKNYGCNICIESEV